jgi:hypothetical protein
MEVRILLPESVGGSMAGMVAYGLMRAAPRVAFDELMRRDDDMDKGYCR